MESPVRLSFGIDGPCPLRLRREITETIAVIRSGFVGLSLLRERGLMLFERRTVI